MVALSRHDYFYEQQRFSYWCLEELDYSICEDGAEDEVGAFPVKLKTPIMGEEQIVRGYPALMDFLGGCTGRLERKSFCIRSMTYRSMSVRQTKASVCEK